jgi:hypothetical protein
LAIFRTRGRSNAKPEKEKDDLFVPGTESDPIEVFQSKNMTKLSFFAW